MKNKKSILFILAFCLVLPLAPLFVACDKNPTPETPKEQTAHVHSWSNEWSTDATNHWHACSGCEETKDLTTHVYDDDHDTTCNTCGYVRAIGDHVANVAWESNETHHWHVCAHDGCEIKFDYAEHDYSAQGICECGYYAGYTLTLGVAENQIKIADNTKTYFKFTASENKDYMVVLNSFIKYDSTAVSKITIYKLVGTEWTLVESNVSSYEYFHIAEAGEYYCSTENCKARNDGKIIVYEENHEADEYGFAPCREYMGTTIAVNTAVENIDLAIGESAYYRFPVQANQHYCRSYSGGIQSSNFARVGVFEDSEWQDFEINQHPKFISNTADDGYCYIVMTTTGVINGGSFTIKTDHEVNDYGYCYAGEYLGRNIGIDQNVTVNLNKDEKAYYRFKDPGDYKLKKTYTGGANGLQNSDFAFYYTDGSGTFISTTFTGTFEDHITSSDGWYYIVITAGANIVNATFSILDDHTEAGRLGDFGVCEVSKRYCGITYNEEGDSFNEEDSITIIPGLSAGETAYYRLAILYEGDTFKIRSATLETVKVYYFNANNVLQEITIESNGETSIQDANVNQDDPYIYITVIAESSMTASEKVAIVRQ